MASQNVNLKAHVNACEGGLGTQKFETLHLLPVASYASSAVNVEALSQARLLSVLQKVSQSIAVGTYNRLILTTGHLSAQMSSGQDKAVMCYNNSTPLVNACRDRK
jgi:hypothetical protein